MRFNTPKFGFALTILFGSNAFVQSWYINSTGGSFPVAVYQEATFSYQFLSTGDFVSYLGEGSTTGKCNIMGYWHTGNVSPAQAMIPTDVKVRDTLICTDVCTIEACGISSSLSPRFDRLSREPLTDFAGSDSQLKASDYEAFPDLQMLPALAGAAVAVYNIPELVFSSNSTGPLVLSRQNIADIFKGKILYWNDSRIISNNNLQLGSLLSGIVHPIRVVVRTDSSGTSEIFSTALSLFDPAGLLAPDYSFGGTIGQGSNPKWCGSLTDEVQIITIHGCNSMASFTSNLIFLKVVDANRIMRDLNFTCDASASTVAAAFLSPAPGPGLSVYVGKNLISADVIKFTIGYSDSKTVRRNWYKPSIVSLPSGVIVTITTLQEGGFFNSHFNSTYYVTPQIHSIWISSLAPPFNYSISWTSSINNINHIIKLNSQSNISASITATYAGSVTSMKRVMSSISPWIEYRLTFNQTASSIFSSFKAVATLSSNDRFIFMNTFLDHQNYPLFYDFLHPRGYGGSGRYTCYLQQYNYEPWSYYTGSTNPGVIAEVFTSPYSIGYSVLTDASASTLPMASLINKASNIVAPTSSSVSYAIMDQGGNLDANFNSVLADGSSLHAWPIAGFSYFVIRNNHHIGSCSRRIAAMSYLYNYYFSDTVKIMASDLGYASLPDFIRNIVVAKLVTSARCQTGEYALEKYVINPLNLMSSKPFNTVLHGYLSVFKVIATESAWNVITSDDSRILWNGFISAKSTTAGIFTLFSSAAQKLSFYTNDMILSSAFAHIAVVTVYHLDKFSVCANSSLRITNSILGGIYSGIIQHWNDTIIKEANAEHSECLPSEPINVVVRSTSSDVNSIFLRYLTLSSPVFRAFYTSSGGDTDHRFFKFSTVIPSSRLVLATDNGVVDNEVVAQDFSIGYYLHVTPPTSNVALFCSDSQCRNTPIVPNDNGMSISLCQNDITTIVNPSENVYSYDLMLSNTKGCYPIVGTVDYSVYTYNDPSTCGYETKDFTSQKLKLSAFLYNGSAIVNPLSMFSAGASTTLQRQLTYSSICGMTCNSNILGYNFCGYRDCSWFDGDYYQLVTDCSATTQRRIVTYVLRNGSDTCISNTPSMPPMSKTIQCAYVLNDSRIATGLIAMCTFGILTCGLILNLVHKYRHQQILKRSQMVFVYIFLIGAILMNLTVLCMYGPNTNNNCMLRVWAVNLSSTLMFAPLIMKLHRVDILFRTLKRGGRRKRISDLTVGFQVLGLVGVDFIILLVWSILARPRGISVALIYPNVYSPIIDNICSSSLDQPFEKVMLVWKASLIAFGILKSIQTWNVPEEISEAKYFAIAVYNIAVVGSFTYFLSVFGNVNVESVMILRGVGLFVSATVSAVVIIVPKLLVIQLSWAEIFLVTRTSHLDDYSYSSSVISPRGAAVLADAFPKANIVEFQGLKFTLDLEKLKSPLNESPRLQRSL